MFDDNREYIKYITRNILHQVVNHISSDFVTILIFAFTFIHLGFFHS